MAALIAAAAEPVPETGFVSLTSEGVTLIYGSDEQRDRSRAAAEGSSRRHRADQAAGRLDAAARHRFPGGQGHDPRGQGLSRRLRTDGRRLCRAAAVVARRTCIRRRRATARDRAATSCSISPAARRCFRPPICATAICAPIPAIRRRCCARCSRRAISTGTFDKPRYINFTADLCAHSRSKIVGCRRCLDLCPTGAIAPDGDHVAIDAHICAGCGQCAAACPTGAAAYALPPSDALLRKLRALLARLPRSRRQAGGGAVSRRRARRRHDRRAGAPRRRTAGQCAAGRRSTRSRKSGSRRSRRPFAYGASAVRFLLRAKPRHDVAGLRQDHRAGRADPRRPRLCRRARRHHRDRRSRRARRGLARDRADGRRGQARDLRRRRRQARRDAACAARTARARRRRRSTSIALPRGAPFGTVEVNVEGCTLCLSCVSACPTGALSDDPERPMLRFAEDACVQCGLCKATCPEKVISLKPQIDFRAATAMRARHQAGRAVRSASAAASRSA